MKPVVRFQSISGEHIALFAYLIWEQEGRPHGRDHSHWTQAESHLIAGFTHDRVLNRLDLLTQASSKRRELPPERLACSRQ